MYEEVRATHELNTGTHTVRHHHLHYDSLSFRTKLKAWVVWIERGLWIFGIVWRTRRALLRANKRWSYVFWFQLPFKSSYFFSEWNPLFTWSQSNPKGRETIWTLFSSLVSDSVNRTTTLLGTWSPELLLIPTRDSRCCWVLGRRSARRGLLPAQQPPSHLAARGQPGKCQPVCGSRVLGRAQPAGKQWDSFWEKTRQLLRSIWASGGLCTSG